VEKDKMILLDSNIFLEMFLRQPKAAQCKDLLDMVSEGALEAVVTRFSVHAIEAILGKAEFVSMFLRNLETSTGLVVYDTGNDDEIAATIVQQKTKLYFDDALQYFVAKKLAVDCIVSFDKHFDGLDIERTEPGMLTGEGRRSAPG
jgi:predicted nucleic acid-binding protein